MWFLFKDFFTILYYPVNKHWGFLKASKGQLHVEGVFPCLHHGLLAKLVLFVCNSLDCPCTWGHVFASSWKHHAVISCVLWFDIWESKEHVICIYCLVHFVTVKCTSAKQIPYKCNQTSNMHSQGNQPMVFYLILVSCEKTLYTDVLLVGIGGQHQPQ